MPGFRESVADAPQGSGATEVPVASWYAQGITDGLGDRLLMSDNLSDSSLELLRFRRDLAAAPGFERILRGTVARLARFDHAAFAHVRAVEQLESDGGLALVSTHIPGRRLSEMFKDERVAGVHPAFVAWLIRWLTPAIADLRERTGIAHGTIAPERIVMAPDGRPVLVEQVVGRPIEGLGLSPDQLWRHFGLVVPPVTFGTPRLDDRSDVYQLGWVALSLLLGRRLTPPDLGGDLQQLLDEFSATPDGRASSFTPALCLWLDRALRTDGGGFRSAQEACDGTRQLSHAPRPDVRGLHADRTTREETVTPLAQDLAQAQSFWRFFTARTIAAGLALVVVIQAVVIVMLLNGRPQPPQAVAEGEALASPLTVAGIDATTPSEPADVQLPAPTPAARAARAVQNAAPARAAPSGVRLVSPIDLQVFEGTRVLGSSTDGPIALAPGRHQLEFVNDTLGYRARQTVDVRSGEIGTLTIQPPGGRVSINAQPWAQVWINGKPVGETPIAYLPVSAGEHEIVFRHPDHGERRETLLVRSGAEARVSANFIQ